VTARTAATALALTVVLALSATACNTNTSDAGCQRTTEVELAGTPLTLLSTATLVPANDGYVLVGDQGSTLRWATLTTDGALGTEQTLAVGDVGLPPVVALAGGAGTTVDTLLSGIVSAAANGVDTELHFTPAPLDGTTAAPPGSAVVTFAGGTTAAVPPMVAVGTAGPRAAPSPQQAMSAGLAWVDTAAGALKFAFIDDHGELVGTSSVIDTAALYECLTVTSQTIDPKASFLVSFLRHDTTDGPPIWEEAEMSADGRVETLTASVAEAGKAMGCAVGTPTTGFDYSFAWQDYSGSWLSILSGRMDDGNGGFTAGRVLSYPFVAATDFGGPNIQPPIVALSTIGGGTGVPFTGDYGVLFARDHGPELWRVDASGNRRPGALVFPSQNGYVGGVSAIGLGSSGVVATYADYDTAAATSGGRWLVNATCY
jgi:hypothetical protein